MFLKKRNVFAFGEKRQDVLKYSCCLPAECLLIETLQPSAPCTLAGSSVLFFF